MSSILTQKYCDIDKFQKLKNLKNHWCGCQKVFLQIISVSKFGSAAEWRARQGFVKSINTTWTFWTTRVVVVVVLTTGINVIHRRVESIVIFSDCLPGVVATKTRRKEMFSLIFPPHSLFPLSHSHSLAFNHWRRGLTIPRSRRRQGGRRQLLPVTKNSRL